MIQPGSLARSSARSIRVTSVIATAESFSGLRSELELTEASADLDGRECAAAVGDALRRLRMMDEESQG